MRRLKRAQQKHARKQRKLKHHAVTAGAIAAITLAAAANKASASTAPDPHQLSVHQDADIDLLANREEAAIGFLPFEFDQNRNTIFDGAELARHCAAAIEALPGIPYGSPIPPPDEIHKIEHFFYGLEKCKICGEHVNMGGWEIVNPKLNLRYPDPNDPMDPAILPVLALHYMQHGSFDCFGTIHQGRINIQRLMRVLEQRYPIDPNEHRLALNDNDLDDDLLADTEELTAGYDLYDADQNNNLIPDGIELAKQCTEIIDTLPIREPGEHGVTELHKVSYMQRGLEICDVCGKSVNMGYWLIVNPELESSIEVPEIICHYMQHGSFSYSGNVHGKDRINVPQLVHVLQMPRRCGDLGTVYMPGDSNKDCAFNFDDLAELAQRWLLSTNPELSNEQ